VRVVTDAGPVIHLSGIRRLELLSVLFDEVVLPPAVRDEVLSPPPGTRGFEDIQRALDRGALRVRALDEPERGTLRDMGPIGLGEAEAIALAQVTGADLLLSDDARARDVAIRLGLTVSGTLGVLRAAREAGAIRMVLPLVLDLQRLGQWLSPRLLVAIQREEEALKSGADERPEVEP
jgi:predicted nucleic acid-binding protein